MNKLRRFFLWRSLYILIMLLLGGVYWEETLQIGSFGHDLLIVFLFLLFGILIHYWILHHEANFIISLPGEVVESYRQIDVTLKD